MNPLFTSLPHRRFALRRQDGFTLVLTLLTLLITSVLLVAAFTAANGEVHLTATDTAQKKAYYAAEAGIENYEYHLTQDGNYLTYCTTPTPENPALNQEFQAGTEKPLTTSELKEHTAEVPEVEGKKSEEKYAIQLVPAESAPSTDKKCDRNNVVGTMIEENEGPAAGTFRIMSTGFSGKQTRTLVATFRNANFVSYVWYSVYETGDPVLYGTVPTGDPSTWWTECGKFYTERPGRCNEFNNYFISGESVNGPMHTEDHVGICGNPTFGRSKKDRIEFGNGYKKEVGAKGYSNESGCSEAESNPKFVGELVPPDETLQITPPPGDEELEHIVETSPVNYEYEGQTEIILTGETMTVIKHKGNGKTIIPNEVEEKGVALPPNGVIYVSSEEHGSCPPYSPFGPVPGYAEGSVCGDVYVHGEYDKALTIASQNDVIINGNVYPQSVAGKLGSEATGNTMLGLIANNFVRVYHPLEGTRGTSFTSCGSAKDASTDIEEPFIYAAILALKHSFIVDNFDCGKPLKKLNVFGAIAGEFSNGMTGVFSGTTAQTGYPYSLKYDNRLQAEEPPHFLNPIQAAWYIQRQTLASKP
jgi:Tfp pilus assembly protein PilX